MFRLDEHEKCAKSSTWSTIIKFMLNTDDRCFCFPGSVGSIRISTSNLDSTSTNRRPLGECKQMTLNDFNLVFFARTRHWRNRPSVMKCWRGKLNLHKITVEFIKIRQHKGGFTQWICPLRLSFHLAKWTVKQAGSVSQQWTVNIEQACQATLHGNYGEMALCGHFEDWTICPAHSCFR